MLNNLVFMHKIKSQAASKIFQNKFRISILQMSQHLTKVYHHLNQGSLNTEFQPEAPHYGKTFLQTLEKMQESVTAFKNSMRRKLLELQNETSYF